MNLLKIQAFLLSAIVGFTTQDVIAADLNQTKENFSAKVVKTYSYNYLKYLPKNYDGKTKFRFYFFYMELGNAATTLKK